MCGQKDISWNEKNSQFIFSLISLGIKYRLHIQAIDRGHCFNTMTLVSCIGIFMINIRLSCHFCNGHFYSCKDIHTVHHVHIYIMTQLLRQRWVKNLCHHWYRWWTIYNCRCIRVDTTNRIIFVIKSQLNDHEDLDQDSGITYNTYNCYWSETSRQSVP